MTVPQIDPYPAAPGPSDPGEVFDEKAFDFTQSLEPRRQQMNQVAQFVNDAVTQFGQDLDQAVASANTATQAASNAESHRTAAQDARDETVQARDTAVQASSDASNSATVAQSAASAAQQHRDDAAAIVTGGTATVDPEPGKIPLGDASGKIKPGWIPEATTAVAGTVRRATSAEALSGAAGAVPDAAGVHAAFKQFGLGAQVVATETNANLYRTAGSYITPSTGHTNFPAAGNNSRAIITVTAGSSYIEQVVQQRLPPYRRFVRATSTADLETTPWVEIFHQHSIVGSVYESGGIPTGAIIERGSNANGEYVKFADGTLICSRWRTGETVAEGINAPDSLFEKTWTFPSVFVGDAKILGSISLGSGSLSIRYSPRISNTHYGTTSAAYAIETTASMPTGSYSFFEQLIAVGRWFL